MDFFRLTHLNICLSVVTLFSIITLSSTVAHADANQKVLAALQAGLEAREKALLTVASDLNSEELRGSSQQTLNRVVLEGIFALRNNGDQAMADRYENDWNAQYSTYFVSPSFTDLGDHQALSKWLADFYNKLEDRLGYSTVHSGILGDIYLMNYAIPIVFSPKGDWRSVDPQNRDWVEYRKHFIPFANVITYWGVLIACNRLIKGAEMGKQGKKLCTQVSEKLRHLMGRYIAPKISDFTFNKANGISTQLNITDQDRVYLTAESLLQAIERDAAVAGGAL